MRKLMLNVYAQSSRYIGYVKAIIQVNYKQYIYITVRIWGSSESSIQSIKSNISHLQCFRGIENKSTKYFQNKIMHNSLYNRHKFSHISKRRCSWLDRKYNGGVVLLNDFPAFTFIRTSGYFKSRVYQARKTASGISVNTALGKKHMSANRHKNVSMSDNV